MRTAWNCTVICFHNYQLNRSLLSWLYVIQNELMEDMYTSEEKREWRYNCICNWTSRKCALWSPIHPVTWFFPFIGHIGITDSQGNVYDFQGTYSIGKNHLLFGYPTKYYRFAEAGVNDELWDEAVQKAIRQYKQESYNLWYLGE